MRKCIAYCLLLLTTFTACNTATPEKYFDVAVLNTNMIMDFAAAELPRDLESPSAKMGKTKDEILVMKRKEMIDQKIYFLQENLDKLKGLSETKDTKEMLQHSLALYEYIMPVYRNEYTQLAQLYDEGASKEKIATQVKMIHDKYYTRYNELYVKLMGIGKAYASKHAIEVNWGAN